MLTSGYVALGAFLGLLELATALGATIVGVRSCLALRRVRSDEAAERPEGGAYLAAMLAYLLLGLSLTSWLVLYLILDSFLPQWPAAMCIYGVTRIGEGSRGVYGWLPGLVLLVQLLKPTLVFATGAALILYRFYRRLGAGSLLPRVAALLLVAAVLAFADAATGLTYLAIPKRESLPTSGCCSVSAVGSDRDAPPSKSERQRLYAAYYGCQLLMVVLLCHAIRLPSLSTPRLSLLLGTAAITLLVSMRFLIDVASPVLLHMPYHRCLYDLAADVPESGVALGLLLWGSFCVGWACVVGWMGRSAGPAAASEVRRWPAQALLGYLGSAAMISLDLWLA